MERLLKLLRNKTDQGEIYGVENQFDLIRFENGRLKNITSSIQSGISIRLMKSRRLGFAYTRNLNDPEALIRYAEASRADEMPPNFSFPAPTALPELKTYDPEIEKLTNQDLVAECERVADQLRRRTSAQINIAAYRSCQTIRLMNTQGLAAESRGSQYYFHINLLLPGSYASIDRSLHSQAFKPFSDSELDFVTCLYDQALPAATTSSGPIPALFLPEALYVLTWRLHAGTSGKNVHLRESPLTGRIGQAILSPKLTIYDDSLNDQYPLARAFDDEGTPASRLNIFEKGVLRSFFYDLEYSHRTGTRPTGHGYRSSSAGGDLIATRPEPVLEHLFIAPGDTPLERMIETIDRGVIIAGALGGHSGNIPNGDFSIGLSPGIYVTNGKIRGHLKNAMVAGNVYEVLSRVRSVGDTLYPTFSGNLPALLVDELNLSVPS